ncbi:MAG: phosphoribosyl-ATP diphosphatase [Pseudorhodoplanes sp.]
MSDSLERLHRSVLGLQEGDPTLSRTARLMRAGRAKVAKKLAEEAVEVVIDAMQGNREAVVRESADLLYHLVVLWAEAGIRPQEVWGEMDRREKMMGLAEKLPKDQPKDAQKASSKNSPKGGPVESTERRKVVALETRRIPKRRGPGY